MFSLKDLKEKLSKEKTVETDSDSNNDDLYLDKPITFKVKVIESDVNNFLNNKAKEHNKKNPDKEITSSDVFNAIVEKALLENTLFYKYSKTYNDLFDEALDVRMAVYKLHYFDKETYPTLKENKKLKSEIKSVNNDNAKLIEENNELKSKLDSIKNIV